MKCWKNHDRHDPIVELLRCSLVDSKDEGFLYAGFSKDLLKVGMTHRQCPLCRVIQQNLELKGLRYSPNAFQFERSMLDFLGDPIEGKEWYPKSKLKLLFEWGFLTPLSSIQEYIVKTSG